MIMNFFEFYWGFSVTHIMMEKNEAQIFTKEEIIEQGSTVLSFTDVPMMIVCEVY